MKIAYAHSSDPDTVKIYDTVKALRNNPFIDKTQEDFDAFELARFSSDKNIINYNVIDK